MGRLRILGKARQKNIKKIKVLIKELQRHPFEETGKPEQLTGNLAGSWSRRIDKYNRIDVSLKMHLAKKRGKI